MPEWSGSTGELVWSQCDAGQCGQACCRGKFEHGWGVEGDYPLEALGVSPGLAWPRAPSQHVQHVSQDPRPFCLDLPEGRFITTVQKPAMAAIMPGCVLCCSIIPPKCCFSPTTTTVVIGVAS